MFLSENPTDASKQFINESISYVLFTAGATFLFTVLVSMLIIKRLSHPLRSLTSYVEVLGQGSRAEFPTLPKDEIGKLGDAFEQMRRSLDGKEYVEKYVRTLTHEIKAPLSGIKAASELLQTPMSEERQHTFLDNISRETSRIEQLVDRLLQLSTLQGAGAAIKKERVDLSELLSNLQDSFSSQCSAKQLKLSSSIAPGLIVSGDSFWLEKAVSNILANALDFSAAGKEIALSAAHFGSFAEISVLDRGSGIPEWALEKLFDPFFSLPRPASGAKSSGLGLSLVKEILELHGGLIRVENRENGGAAVYLRLPMF